MHNLNVQNEEMKMLMREISDFAFQFRIFFQIWICNQIFNRLLLRQNQKMLSKNLGSISGYLGSISGYLRPKVGFVVALVWFKPNLSNHVGLTLLNPMDVMYPMSHHFGLGVGACLFQDPRVER